MISIVYVYYNTPNELADSIESIKAAAGNIPYEIIVVNNNSPKPVPPRILKNKKVTIVHNQINFGYGKGLNIGTRRSKGDYLLFVNPDTIFQKNSIRILLDLLKSDKKIGIVGPRLTNTKGKTLQSINSFPNFFGSLVSFSFLKKVPFFRNFSDKYYLKNKNWTKTQSVDSVGGACMMVRKSVFRKVNGFDPRFFMYFEEEDFCRRVRDAGYQVFYEPHARVVHLIGRSQDNAESIESVFESSRKKFFIQYFGSKGLLLEILLRVLKKNSILLFIILSISLFLNLYNLNQDMMFIGDMGHDYLAARNLLLSGRIPLVGIASSVTWLHQGPLSIYFIAIAFLFGKFHPIAPAGLYGLLGVGATYLMYKLGKLYFNVQIGLLSALFFATSPLVVINERMPYHTAPIPFLTIIFFITLYEITIRKKIRVFPYLTFTLGLLLLLELSNAVLFVLLLAVVYFFRPLITRKLALQSFGAFMFGISPFILYDITHHFAQTFGFPLWVLNRIRLFFGLTKSGNSTTAHIGSALQTNWEQISRVIFPASIWIVLIMLAFTGIVLYVYRREKQNSKSLFLVSLWVGIPLLGYSIHAAPGTAYFPLVFGGVCLLISYSVGILAKKSRVHVFAFILLCLFNGYFTIKNAYFLNTYEASHPMPPGSYNFGPYFKAREDIASFIVRDSACAPVHIRGGGFLSNMATGVDNYKYLILWKNGAIAENAKLQYTIYEDKKDIAPNDVIVYRNSYLWVAKNEIH